MTTGLNINLSASTSVVGTNDKSGLSAAQPHSVSASVDTAAVRQTAKNANYPSAVSATENISEQDLQKQKDAQTAELKKQAQNLQELSQLKGWRVDFTIDQDLKETVVKVVDTDTKKVIRQMPSEEMLALAKRVKTLQENENTGDNEISGLLFDSKA
ncbi:flagellar protein FlaG [uncultured Tolumonas sp.]|uniref:flagellar protein FlaG n=1 Tax=uncultured Tolumonas sp. TaxID=263765 RepID=UPI002A0A2801|nr:flagellar protein FlaG [uncultured Tolumonas sp.]